MAAPPPDLLLVRLATVYFDRLSDSWRSWEREIGGVDVQTTESRQEDDGRIRLLLAATVRLRHRPKLASTGALVVPKAEREKTEEAIEQIANLIAVAEGVRRSIASPMPCIALRADGVDGENWLQGAASFDFSKENASSPGVLWQIQLAASAETSMEDRQEGLALLAEALGHAHATGQFHEFIRLFERAFACPANRLAGPLNNFLDVKLGYTEDEIRRWTPVMRDAATHADQRNNIVFEHDTRPVVARMRQAAYDVLFNKANWRSLDAERRDLWPLSSGTTSPRGDVFATQDVPVAMKIERLDPFGAFPRDPNAGIESLPAGWWSADWQDEYEFTWKIVPNDTEPAGEARA